MSQQLTDMEITRVSLVDKGANGRVFAVLKRDEEGSMTGAAAAADEAPAGFVAWLHKMADRIAGKPASIAKTATFAEVVAGAELRDALYDSWYTLEDVLWGAIYAVDENGADLSMEAKTALVGQDLDEFKAYLVAQMASGIQKRAAPAEHAQRSVDSIVEKVGKKVSGDRLTRLQAASEALNSVLAEVVEIEEEAGEAEEAPVEKNELVAAITEAVTKGQEPLIARLEALEKAAAPASEGEADEEVTLETIASAIEKLADRVEAVEKTRGQRTSVAGQDGETTVAKRGTFAGILD